MKQKVILLQNIIYSKKILRKKVDVFEELVRKRAFLLALTPQKKKSYGQVASVKITPSLETFFVRKRSQ